MADVKWIKITTNIFDDEKIKLIDTMPDRDAMLVIWFKLLTLAGKVNDCGSVYIIKEMETTDEMLAALFNRPLNTVRLALQTFQSFNMIEINGQINVVNWDKHQNIDGLDKIREQNRLRQAKFKENKKKKLILEDKSNVTVTLSNATDIEEDIDKELEEDKDIDKQSVSHFILRLESQFEKAIPRTIQDKIKIYSKQYKVNPLTIYEKSDYLRGLTDMKPTLAMFGKEQTYENMSIGMYVNKKTKEIKEVKKELYEYEEDLVTKKLYEDLGIV